MNEMQSPTQLHLIYKLESIRQIMSNTSELAGVLMMAQKAYDISFPVPLEPEFQYKIHDKKRSLDTLASEIRGFQKSNTELDAIKYQLSLTILMLMLNFIGGSLELLKATLHNYDDKQLDALVA